MKLEDVFTEIEKLQHQSITSLKKLIEIPSVSAQNKGHECADVVISLIEKELGFSTQKIETHGFPVVYAERLTDAKHTLAFYNHYDVQDPSPLERWASPPFELTKLDDKLYGRGVSDNKGNLIARIFAIKAYQSVFGELPINIKMIIEGEEEIGSPNLPDFTQKHPHLLKGDFCIWESGHRTETQQQQIWLGVKGTLALELVTSSAKRDIHSSWGGVVENPAWMLIWALNSLKDAGQKILIKGFYDHVLPPTGKELALLEKIPFTEKVYIDDFGVTNFISSGAKLKQDYYYAPILNINGIESGYKGPGLKTIIPSSASAKVEFRLVPNQEPDDILTKLKEHLRTHNFHDVQISSHQGYKPARTAINSPYLKIIDNAARKIYGLPLVVHPTKAGSGPMYLFIDRMDCFAFGCSHPSSHNHSANENILIPDFLQNMKHLSAIIHHFKKNE